MKSYAPQKPGSHRGPIVDHEQSVLEGGTLLIIAFSGTDGAGKSTQIDRLSDRLAADGHAVTYVWARGGYTPLMLAAKTLVLRLLGRRGDSKGFSKDESAGYVAKRAGLMKRPWVARIWLTVAILDMMLLYGVYVRAMSLRGKTVLCDRYIGDTRIDFNRNFPDQFRAGGLLWRMLRLVSPKPNIYYLLIVPVDVSMARSLAKNEPFPDSKETLEFRLKCYQTYQEFSTNTVMAIDGTAAIDTVSAQIWSRLTAAFPGAVTP